MPGAARPSARVIRLLTVVAIIFIWQHTDHYCHGDRHALPVPIRHPVRPPLLFAACALACGASLAAEPLSGTLEKIRQSNLISIGHRETSVPFSYADASGKVIGFSQDLCDRVIAAVKARTGKPDLQVRFIPVTSQNRIPLVQNGTVDLECGVTTNSPRVTRRSRSRPPSSSRRRLLTRTTSGIRDFPDLAGKTVVTNRARRPSACCAR